jgi:hypothetical protein
MDLLPVDVLRDSRDQSRLLALWLCIESAASAHHPRTVMDSPKPSRKYTPEEKQQLLANLDLEG